jgi:hypothetical protein
VSSKGMWARGSALQAKHTFGVKPCAAKKKGKPRHPACRREDQSAGDIGPGVVISRAWRSGRVRVREDVESTRKGRGRGGLPTIMIYSRPLIADQTTRPS